MDFECLLSWFALQLFRDYRFECVWARGIGGYEAQADLCPILLCFLSKLCVYHGDQLSSHICKLIFQVNAG